MATQRNQYSGDFKAKVALEALKEQQTLSELGSCYGVHPTLVAQWKRQLREALPQVFTDRRQKPDRTAEELQAQLYQQFGHLLAELLWLKRTGGRDRGAERRAARRGAPGDRRGA